MFKYLFKLVEWFAKGGVQAFMVQAGLSVLVFSGLDILVTSALGFAIDSVLGLPPDVLKLVQLSGIDDFFNIIGSAILTRLALKAATSSLSMGRA
jgi:hypothetical protein